MKRRIGLIVMIMLLGLTGCKNKNEEVADNAFVDAQNQEVSREDVEEAIRKRRFEDAKNLTFNNKKYEDLYKASESDEYTDIGQEWKIRKCNETSYILYLGLGIIFYSIYDTIVDSFCSSVKYSVSMGRAAVMSSSVIFMTGGIIQVMLNKKEVSLIVSVRAMNLTMDSQIV